MLVKIAAMLIILASSLAVSLNVLTWETSFWRVERSAETGKCYEMIAWGFGLGIGGGISQIEAQYCDDKEAKP